jgi:menaquinol-cytochrome c reductase cytochrome b/c subunit
MPDETPVTEEIFPKDSTKSYALVELMPDEGPMVGKGPDDTVFSFPVVLLWEIILLLGVTFAIFLFSLIKEAPLDEIANPLLTTDPAKAPWYFVGLQELLEHMHPTVAGVLIPTALVLFLVSLPYIDYSSEGVGRWFSSKRGRRITLWTALYTLIVMTTYIVLDNEFTLREELRDDVAQWIAQGVAPGGILVILAFIPALWLRFKNASRREIVMALFTVMIVAAFVFTLSGFLFRGPGFKLYWPWEMPNNYNPFDDF